MSFLYRPISYRDRNGTEIAGMDPPPAGRVLIPEEAEGLPVLSIGKSAFIRTELRELILPGSLLRIQDFAFYYCRKLGHITMTDSVEDYSDGAFRQCRSLKEIEITMARGNYSLLSRILRDTDQALIFHLHLPEGEAKLYFPEYASVYYEDTRARAFHPSIQGAGYPYRECVSSSGIDWRGYDSLFSVTASTSPASVLPAALLRILYPVRLRDDHAGKYRAFLMDHIAEVLQSLIESGGASETAALRDLGLIGREAAAASLAEASRRGRTEISGILMDCIRREDETAGGQAGSAEASSAFLEDW